MESDSSLLSILPCNDKSQGPLQGISTSITSSKLHEKKDYFYFTIKNQSSFHLKDDFRLISPK
jgi:hypothetical protein